MLERKELEPLLRTSYELVVSGLPHSRRPWAAALRRRAREPASRRKRARR